MARYSKGITIFVTILLGVILQVVLVLADSKDTPHKAVVEFSKAYFDLDRSMTDRLCGEQLEADGVERVRQYIDRAQKEARDRGFGKYFTNQKLYHIKTQVVSQDGDQAQIKLNAIRKNPLRSFFAGESHTVEETIDLVREDGTWKVCGDLFSLSEG